MNSLAILQPVLAMCLLTVVITLWMFFTRIPAMLRLNIHPQQGQDTRKLREHLPHEANRVANNYNHLFEQPVVFYALCLSLAVLGWVDSVYVSLAWIYVVLRSLHSLVQAAIDKVVWRFSLFVFSWMVLMAMIVRACLRAFVAG